MAVSGKGGLNVKLR